MLIFAVNGMTVLFWYALSFTGLSFVFIFNAIYQMGTGWSSLTSSPVIYYSVSASHGFLEWLACFVVFAFTIDHLQTIYLFFRKKANNQQLIAFYLHAIKKTIPATLLILLVAAALEVYVSNKLLLLLLNWGGD